jgi:tetratricopeptide (TPR) repeat protein
MKVCVYAICQNEEKFIKRWYESVKEADLIVVSDTGSTDNSVKLLKELGIIVHSININPWRFDEARNKAMSFIPEDVDICVSVDLDEVFETGWRKNVEKAWKKGTTRLTYNYNWSLDENGNPNVSFMREQIHNRNDYKWTHPVHEVLEYVGKGKEQMDYATGVTLNHYPDNSKSRAQYLTLLELSVKENPEDDRNMHYLGREYMYYEEWDKSIEILEKHLLLKNATWKDERCASMRYIARCYQNKDNYDEAKKWLYKAIIEAPYLREPYVEMALLEHDKQNFIACLHMCDEALKIKNKAVSYINESFAWDSTIFDLLSICYYNLGLYTKALDYSNEALKLNPNDERLIENNKLFKDKINS